jgi:hypothetical protein
VLACEAGLLACERATSSHQHRSVYVQLCSLLCTSGMSGEASRAMTLLFDFACCGWVVRMSPRFRQLVLTSQLQSPNTHTHTHTLLTRRCTAWTSTVSFDVVVYWITFEGEESASMVIPAGLTQDGGSFRGHVRCWPALLRALAGIRVQGAGEGLVGRVSIC